MKPELNDILTFVAVVDAQSFTDAANRLGLPKSTVSRKVTRLEEHLGAKLLQRSTRSLAITEVGKRFYEHGARIARELEFAEGVVHELNSTPHGLLRLTLPVEMGPAFMNNLKQFLETYPKVSLELDLTNRYVDLIAEGYDLAIRAGNRIEASGLMARRLGTNSRCVVGTPEYFNRHGRPQKPEDLADHECILFPTFSQHRQWEFVVDGQRHKVPISGRLSCNNLVSVLAAVEAGLGIGYLPDSFCHAGISSGVLEEVLPSTSNIEGAVWLVYPENRHPLPKVRAFIDFMIDLRREFQTTPLP